MVKVIYTIIVFSLGYYSITEFKEKYHQHKIAN